MGQQGKSTRKAARLAAIFLGTLMPWLGPVSTRGQTANNAQLEQDRPAGTFAEGSAARFRVSSDLVLVPVTVLTANGRVVPGLEKEHFSVFEDHTEQTITHFTSEDAPATIGFVFDISDSMERNMVKSREAVHAIVGVAHPKDEFFFVSFNDWPAMNVRMTTNAEDVNMAADTLRVHGATALIDAVAMALREMNAHAHYTRKAIIVISDGDDNSSHMTVDELKQFACSSDTLIYTLFVGDMPDFSYQRRSDSRGPGLLEFIAKQSGGRMFVVNKLKQLPEIAKRIGAWVRSQYVLGYVPSAASKDGQYHKIQVKIRKPDGFPRLQVTWRLGYYAPNQ